MREGEGTLRLELFVSRDCASCARARALAARAAAHFPALSVEVVDLDESPVPPEIFATPTFRLEGHIVSLGTPTWESLARRIAERL